MSDDRLQLHVADWMRQLTLPATVELRCREEIIDSVTLESAESPFATLAADLLESSATDAADEGKTRVYTLVAIDANSERYICPLRVRRRVDKSAGEMLSTLARQNSELHAALVKKDKEAAELLLKFAQTLASDRERLVAENTSHRARVNETIDKLEALRSQQLERDLVLEKHRSDIEVRERLTDAAVPLALAIGSRLTGGAVPSDLPNSMFAEVVKSLSEKQLKTLQAILGADWRPFEESFTNALSGQADVRSFRALVEALPGEKAVALAGALNMGQQAALKEILNGSN